MNTERLKLLAQRLREAPERSFQMNTWLYQASPYSNEDESYFHRVAAALAKFECGTSGCIAGHTVALFGLPHHPMSICAEATEHLELTLCQEDWLFYGGFRDKQVQKSLGEITPFQAAAAIDCLLAHPEDFQSFIVMADGRVKEKEDVA